MGEKQLIILSAIFVTSVFAGYISFRKSKPAGTLIDRLEGSIASLEEWAKKSSRDIADREKIVNDLHEIRMQISSLITQSSAYGSKIQEIHEKQKYFSNIAMPVLKDLLMNGKSIFEFKGEPKP